MANNPKKIPDATDAALSAIQEALKVRDKELEQGEPTAAAAPSGNPAASTVTGDNEAIGARASDQRVFAANDDQQSIGQVLRILQSRPPRTSYVVAALFSGAWVIACIALSVAYLATINAALGPEHSSASVIIGLVAAALLPIIFFFGVAHMAWRAQELRLVAQSMARVAMRLAEPEGVARDSIVTVGQAIRREVAAMGDGVERALARAGELETLVRNEVAALERSYSDNEVRIRGLIEDLTNQRETLVGQAEQVRSAINNVHVDLTQDLSTISDLVGQQVNEAADRITQSLAEKGDNITAALGQIGDNMIHQLGGRGDDLIVRLESASEDASRALAGAGEQLTAALTFKTEHINEEFAEIARGLESMMATRLDGVADGFSEKSLAIVDMMVGRSQEVTDSVVNASSQLAETIATRAEEVNSTLKASGESLILDLNLRGGDVAKKLEAAGNRVTETLVARTTKIQEDMQGSAEQVAKLVAKRGDEIKQVLTTRMAAFEEAFNQSGTQLGEKISRDSSTLGALITRHLAEFDRTVKTYGSELVERLGARTQEVSESMRNYVDNFDSRVTVKAAEVTGGLDQRLAQFQQVLDSRSQTLTEGLGARLVEITKTLADGGREVATAMDQRIGDVNATLDARIDQMEKLLVGRTDTVTQQLDVRSRAAANMISGRIEELAETIRTNSEAAAHALDQVTARTAETLGKSTAAGAAAADALNRSAADVTTSLSRSAAEATASFNRSAAEVTTAFNRSTAEVTASLNRSVGVMNNTITKASEGAVNVLAQGAAASSEAISRSASAAERTLIATSAEVARTVSGRADEITATVTQRVGELTRLLDEKSNVLLTALSGKGQEFAGEVGRITDQAVKSIEAKSFVFTQTMMDNSEEIARLINDASQNASVAMTRSLGQLQQGAQTATEAAKQTITRTLEDLHGATRSAIEESKQTASATVADMLETHGMLRSDTTALFERLREANILLQEVLSGAHENMSSLERTMVTRVSEFVAAMNDLSVKSDATAGVVERHLSSFNNTTSNTLRQLGEVAAQFTNQSRSLADAVEKLEQSNRRTEESVTSRRAAIEALLSTLDVRSEDFGERLQRFATLLDESLDAATTRASEIAGIIATTSDDSVRTIEQQYELVRATSEEERKRTGESMNAVYDEAGAQVHAIFNQTAERFAEIMQGMRQMAKEMQQELETTRAELRRGIFELPQETAESAAQMRRVIVDQIEALAELNRIVARHGRGVDTAEPPRRDVEPAYAAGGGRGQQRQPRGDITAAAQPPARGDITGAPRRPEPPQNGNGGWMSDLLTRASRDESPPIAPATRGGERAARDNLESLETLAVDIARMIDHDAAVEAWERHKRGEHGVFTKRLYTAPGQKAFDEIRRRYRSDPEFRQTVEQYIHEFERLLDDVSRGDRGPAVTRNYLTSDTGKVYTLLAHAAGRFDQ